MKKILIILVALFSFLYVKADVIKMQSIELALKLYDYETQSWDDWSDWEDCSVLIVINTDNDTFTIYSSQIQQYDIYISMAIKVFLMVKMENYGILIA